MSPGRSSRPPRGAEHGAARAFLLDPSTTFLNHGSYGAVPRAVFDRRVELLLEQEREPVAFYDALEERLDEVRVRLAALVGCAPRALAFVPNATTAVNAVLRSVRLAAGDEILVTDHEYAACKNAADFHAKERGARVVVVPVPFPLASEARVVERLLAAKTPRTRLVLIDHVTSPTGLVQPIEPIVRAFEADGVPVLVDGAHAVGMIPLALESLGASFYTSNCHKWLCAPRSAAFLYAREDVRAQVRPTVISHGAGVHDRDRPRYQLEFDWPGTWDPTPVLAIPAAIDFLEGAWPGGLVALMERNHELALFARGVLLGALGLGEVPAPASMLGSLAAVPLPDGDAVRLHALLKSRYRIQVPIPEWPRRPKRLLRVSAQLYNRPEDYERLAAVLPEALADA